MRRLSTLLQIALVTIPAYADHESALAPYPERREEPYGTAAEELLTKVEANAPENGAFSATVSWQTDSERRLVPSPYRFGLFSLKSRPDWRFSQTEGTSKQGRYTIEGIGTDWRIEEAGGGDWWQKAGEAIYSKVFSADWPTVWRLHGDALESGMVGYCEGLGLLLWAFNPGEYIRRAENLQVGRDQVFAGRSCTTLVATPNWITAVPVIESADAAKRMTEWAAHRPAVTCFIDQTTGVIAGAEFVYYTVRGRDTAQGFAVEPQANGIVVTCAVEQLAEQAGTVYATRISAEITDGGQILRRTSATVALGGPPTVVPPPVLPEDKYVIDPWPQYRIEQYQQAVEGGQGTLADLIGFARAFCREGDAAAGEMLLFDAVKALQDGPGFRPMRPGSVDWEVGEAFTSLIDRYTLDEIDGLWSRIPRNATWLEVSARGIRLYQKLRSTDKEKIDLFFDRFKVIFEEPRQQELEKESLRNYRSFLLAQLKTARERELANKVSQIEQLLQDIEAQLAAR